MNKLNYIIVEDNKLARMAMAQIASNIGDIHLVNEFESAIDAYNFIDHQSIDFVLLDIEMPGMSGLEFAKKLSQKNIYVIFTTGKEEYAIEAFDTNVVDYLLKPISVTKLITAVDKLKELVKMKTLGSLYENEYFFIKDKSALVKLMMKNVLYFDAMGDYVKVHTTEKSYLIHSTLKKIEEKLNPNEFIRVHRSHIIALKHIDKIEEGVIYIQQYHVTLADSYKSVLNDKLNQF